VLDRNWHSDSIRALLGEFPVVALLGARQVGKTTLALSLAQERGEVTRFDLEDPMARERLRDPMLALRELRGLVVIDEIQRAPEIFGVLRVLADRTPLPARFLVLGSASLDLLRQTSESLAGRIAFHELRPFDLHEVGFGHWSDLWLRGGFPRSFLATSGAASVRWRRAFVRTYLERDLPQLGIRVPGATIRRFWTMVAHYHGQTWNGAELARAFGISQSTVRHYLDILVATYMARRLEPWHENLAKRQVKSPKVFLADSGLLHLLLGIEGPDALVGHPKVGASFEGFAIEQVIRCLGAEPEECFTWALHSGADLDLLIVRGGVRLGFEIKRTSAPRPTRSMRTALDALRLERIDVVYPGSEIFPMAERIRAVGIESLAEALKKFSAPAGK
jgi:predicted AAA+ superfamily ATPase